MSQKIDSKFVAFFLFLGRRIDSSEEVGVFDLVVNFALKINYLSCLKDHLNGKNLNVSISLLNILGFQHPAVAVPIYIGICCFSVQMH